MRDEIGEAIEQAQRRYDDATARVERARARRVEEPEAVDAALKAHNDAGHMLAIARSRRFS